MSRKVTNRSTRLEQKEAIPEPKTFSQTREKRTVQRKRRPTYAVQQSKEVEEVRKIIESEPRRTFYLGFGGTGDALLTLTSCWNDPNARVFFYANGGSIRLAQQFFDLFNVTVRVVHNIMGSPIAPKVYDLLTKHPNFRTSGHLADGCFYGDWKNVDKYAARLNSHMPWVNVLGSKKTKKPHIVIAPSGSERNPSRQRYITPIEYGKLVDKYVDKGFTVYTVGSENDYKFYKSHAAKSIWLSSYYLRAANATRTHSLKDLLQVVNGARKVLSMDTWLKTYSLLCDIPTTVIRTRWNGVYYPYGRDVTDFIFLSKKIWPKIKFAQIEELI